MSIRRWFFASYPWLPHRLLNASARILTRSERPRWLVQAAIRAWIKRDQIDMSEAVVTEYATIEAFFLRRLVPGSRTVGEGVIAPADGRVVQRGRIEEDTILQVKGVPMSVQRLVNGSGHDLDTRAFAGGRYITTFLSPRGYHFVHMPMSGLIERVQWIPGRFFPQNEHALQHIAGIYERNERATLFGRDSQGCPFIMVLVGASLIGSIELKGLERSAWVGDSPLRPEWQRDRGDELGHFTFGSTVVLLLPPSLPGTTQREV
ncbi:MAG: phosphatidylserine decarboxylase, partial [Kiritimatiellia bacterium]